jgi:serpin B
MGFVTGCSACGSATTTTEEPPSRHEEPPLNETPRANLPPPSDAEGALFAARCNPLGVDLLKRAVVRRANVAISPASITTALAMTYGGARGETAAQMARVMHHEGAPEALHDATSRVLASWNTPGEHELRVVNRLFGERTFRFEEPFLAMTRDRYGAALEPMDFRGAPDPSRAHINRWVAEQTNDRIRDLLPPRSIDDTTRMVLTNAVYFLGRWVSPFARELTRSAPFHRLDGSTAQVPTMNQTEHFGYAEDADAQVIELPYRGEQLSMLFVLPRQRDGLPALVDALTAERIAGWSSALSPRNVWAAIPKVTIDPPEPMALAHDLAELGMPLAFDDMRADFTAMGVPPNPEMRLYISQVFHKAFVKIDEEGTEAAAATAVVMAEGGGMPAEPTMFRADHPFLFILRDRRSGAVMFFGLVFDP